MTTFTICLPHKRNPGNDKALAVCLSCLYDNTANPFKLIVDAEVDEPLYPRVNRMVEQADTEICVYWASDFFAAPQWDEPMVEAYDPLKFITNVLVEPGTISMHGQNLHRDFGRKPETFRRAEFEQWAVEQAPMLDGPGWFAPYLFSRQRFLELGGLCESDITDPQGFTNADELLFQRHKASGGIVQRVKSFVYHLQRYSQIEEQEHPKRG